MCEIQLESGGGRGHVDGFLENREGYVMNRKVNGLGEGQYGCDNGMDNEQKPD